MIVDCHTHIWQAPQQLGADSAEYVRRQGGPAGLSATTEAHWEAAECVDCSFVSAFRSSLLGADVPNEWIASYVSEHPDRLIGFASIDPLGGDVGESLAYAADQSAFAGVTLSPAGQGFHPTDSRADRIYRFCADRGMPILVQQGAQFGAKTKMEFARPYLWDEVLREYPALKLVISHMGHPWVDEAIALVGKHAGAYADIAGLIRRPWAAYNVLVRAHQFGVTDKLLFGSDFPYYTASEAVESVYRLNETAHGTNMPIVPREQLRGIVERDTLRLLQIVD